MDLPTAQESAKRREADFAHFSQLYSGRGTPPQYTPEAIFLSRRRSLSLWMRRQSEIEEEEKEDIDERAKDTYTPEEVGRHNTLEDCWVSLHGYVFDITEYRGEHPGGQKVLAEYAGKDVTAAWRKLHHPASALQIALQNFLIGKLRDKADSSSSSSSSSASTSTSSSAYPSPEVITPLPPSSLLSVEQTLHSIDADLLSSNSFIRDLTRHIRARTHEEERENMANTRNSAEKERDTPSAKPDRERYPETWSFKLFPPLQSTYGGTPLSVSLYFESDYPKVLPLVLFHEKVTHSQIEHQTHLFLSAQVRWPGTPSLSVLFIFLFHMMRKPLEEKPISIRKIRKIWASHGNQHLLDLPAEKQEEALRVLNEHVTLSRAERHLYLESAYFSRTLSILHAASLRADVAVYSPPWAESSFDSRFLAALRGGEIEMRKLLRPVIDGVCVCKYVCVCVCCVFVNGAMFFTDFLSHIQSVFFFSFLFIEVNIQTKLPILTLLFSFFFLSLSLSPHPISLSISLLSQALPSPSPS